MCLRIRITCIPSQIHRWQGQGSRQGILSSQFGTCIHRSSDQWFGNTTHVAEAYKSCLPNWLQIKDQDSIGLQVFLDFLLHCQEAVKTVGSKSELDSNQKNLIQVSTKLPSYSGVKWCRHAYKTRTKSDSKAVTFSKFIQFEKGESKLANDPGPAGREKKKGHMDNTTKEYRSRGQNK